MHELTLAASLIELTEQHALASGLSRILRVHVAFGALAPVDQEALTFGFEVARRGTIAESAELIVEFVAARASCLTCGAAGVTFAVQARGEPCPTCGSFAWKLIEGGELRLTGLEGI